MDEKEMNEKEKLDVAIERIDGLEKFAYNLDPNIMVRMDHVESHINVIENDYTTSTVTDIIAARLDHIEAAMFDLEKKLNRIMKYLPDETKLCLEVMEGED